MEHLIVSILAFIISAAAAISSWRNSQDARKSAQTAKRAEEAAEMWEWHRR